MMGRMTQTGNASQESEPRRVVAGIVAHVDAGKTTLSEALLYTTGAVRTAGRVDHGDAFLDPDPLEKRSGITIHAHQACIRTGNLELTLLDTPGHVDFAADTERVLRVLDYAILVISGTDGVQGHTEMLWRLLERYDVPVIVFVNKMDAPGADRDAVLRQLQRRLSHGIVPLDGGDDADGADGVAADGATGADGAAADGATGASDDDAIDVGDWGWYAEDVIMQDDAATEEYLDTGALRRSTVRRLIASRIVFPVFFGSALHMSGIREFLDGLGMWMQETRRPAAFGAKVYRISHDERHNRLTWLRVTGGELHAKDVVREIPGGGRGLGTSDDGGDADDGAIVEKIDQVRIYNGAKYEVVTEVPAGGVCAVTGLERTFPGQGLGFEPDAGSPTLQPVLTYSVWPAKTPDWKPSPIAPHPVFDDLTLHRAIAGLRELEDEEPMLDVAWVERLRELQVRVMGEMQLELIHQVMLERFGIDVGFGNGGIVYRETVTEPMEGVGHFEPLRHYAEAHILIEPGEPGSGVRTGSDVSLDVLDRNWQRLILTHLAEKEHLGVLIGAPLTDVKLTLVAGKAHLKHTEGGDFRQATYRAVRQGLMELRERDACRLLEPWYAFRLDVPADCVGRAMSDVQLMRGDCAIDDDMEDTPEGSGVSGGFGSDGFGAGGFGPDDGAEGIVTLTGHAPVARMSGYATDVNAYTHGRGHIICTFDGYRPCRNEIDVVQEARYDPVSDLDNTPDSVFCAHGAGYPVSWRDVPAHKHLDWATQWHV